jgi:hypothetical protein
MQFAWGGLGVFQRVVQDRCGEDLDIRNTALLGKHAGHCEGMIDVWRTRMVFSALITMLVSSECGGTQQ